MARRERSDQRPLTRGPPKTKRPAIVDSWSAEKKRSPIVDSATVRQSIFARPAQMRPVIIGITSVRHLTTVHPVV
eukprot:7230526-Lingulodinium_polyedra.AAC.1